MASLSPSKRLVIFCDGTWCGRETGTNSNIRILADMVGEVRFIKDSGDQTTTVHPVDAFQPNVVAGYQEGVGLNKTFLEYLWDGTTASTIGDECTSIYKFIVDNYTDDYEIWMFAFSRGSYTVRCVAGMINNCGIIKKHPDLSDVDVSTLCHQVYQTYRSTLDIDHPRSDRCTRLREDNTRVWPAKRPIRLMCIADTVGALGIPRLNAGIGFDWPEFYDQKISTVVQEVYHGPSLHDRLWIFQPCLVFNGPGASEVKINQTWFPGCHYDLGRQKFRFVREAPANQLEKILGALPDRLSKTILPNEVLSDVLLRWMLQCIQSTEATDVRSVSLIPNLPAEIDHINVRLASSSSPTAKSLRTGSGDIYGDILPYAPAGTLFAPLMTFGSTAISLLNKAFPKLGDNIQDLLGIKTILRILTATRDRRIPGTQADVYKYNEVEWLEVRGMSKKIVVEESARMRERRVDGQKEIRYPSRTMESWGVWKKVFGGVGGEDGDVADGCDDSVEGEKTRGN